MGLSTLKITAEGITFETKLENLCGKADPREIEYKGETKMLDMKSDGSPVIIRKHGNSELRFARIDKNTGAMLGDSASVYVGEEDDVCEPEDIEYFYQTPDGELIPAIKNTASGEFSITSFMSEAECFNDYLIDKHYQLIPYQGTSKSSKIRETVRASQVTAMRRLWDLLDSTKTVGKGQVCLTSAGWLPSVAFIRAVRKEFWTLEMGIARQRKQHTWREEHDFKLTPKEQEVITHKEL